MLTGIFVACEKSMVLWRQKGPPAFFLLFERNTHGIGQGLGNMGVSRHDNCPTCQPAIAQKGRDPGARFGQQGQGAGHIPQVDDNFYIPVQSSARHIGKRQRATAA
jgi:hypothetical protein